MKQLDTQLPGGVRASPVARRMADEQGVDLVMGSGPTGRVTRKDIEAIASGGSGDNTRPVPVSVSTPTVTRTGRRKQV
jgi:pyruvate/2-oxoglutarate dehydrogenase complex dihydrolipoamide acyltransferase (E2) component